jgi:hypothetical protein
VLGSIQRGAIWIATPVALAGVGYVEWRYGDPKLKEVLGWVGTLVSTFVGAAMAFAFNGVRVSKDKEEKECVAGNLALITLVEFLDRLHQYDRDFIQPAKNANDAWFSIRPGPFINVEPKIDRASLAFLLTKHPMTWRAIVLEEMRFNVFRDAIERRNALINEKVWPKMEAKGISHGASLATAEVEDILGPATTQDLKGVTAHLVDNCEKNIQSLNTCIANVRKVLVEKYPRKEFVKTPKRLRSTET